MPIPGMSRNDMVAIQKREIRTEDRLEKARDEIVRLKARNAELRETIKKLRLAN